MLFLDVSSFQGGIDFARIKKTTPDVVGVWVKATQGASYTNPFMKQQAQDARKAGLRVGFYHFASVDTTADWRAEAMHFANVIRPVTTRKDLRPVLDFETKPKPLLPTQYVTWARAWTQETKRRTGVGALFYSYPDFIKWLDPKAPIGYGLWLASYGRNDGHEYPAVAPEPWMNVLVHQFSSRCRVAGCDGYVDMSSAKKLMPLLANPITGRPWS